MLSFLKVMLQVFAKNLERMSCFFIIFWTRTQSDSSNNCAHGNQINESNYKWGNQDNEIIFSNQSNKWLKLKSNFKCMFNVYNLKLNLIISVVFIVNTIWFWLPPSFNK